MGERSLANQRGGGGVDAVSTGGAVGNDGVVRRGDKLLAGVGKEQWRRRGRGRSGGLALRRMVTFARRA